MSWAHLGMGNKEEALADLRAGFPSIRRLQLSAGITQLFVGIRA